MKNHRPRLIIILPYLKAGGTERQAFQILLTAKKNQYNVKLVVIERCGSLIDSIDSYDITFLDIEFKKLNALEKYF